MDALLGRKPLDEQHLRPHFKALDSSYRGMAYVFKTLTYEQGRITAEFSTYPQECVDMIAAAVQKINDAGLLLKKAARQVRAEARGVDEED